jgi:hypothetical protein
MKKVLSLAALLCKPGYCVGSEICERRANMRRIVALMLLTILPFSLLAQQTESVPEDTDYDKGYTEGQQDGLNVGQWKWEFAGWGGVVSWAVVLVVA